MADEVSTDIVELKKLDSSVTITVEEVPNLSSKDDVSSLHAQKLYNFLG